MIISSGDFLAFLFGQLLGKSADEVDKSPSLRRFRPDPHQPSVE